MLSRIQSASNRVLYKVQILNISQVIFLNDLTSIWENRISAKFWQMFLNNLQVQWKVKVKVNQYFYKPGQNLKFPGG